MPCHLHSQCGRNFCENRLWSDRNQIILWSTQNFFTYTHLTLFHPAGFLPSFFFWLLSLWLANVIWSSNGIYMPFSISLPNSIFTLCDVQNGNCFQTRWKKSRQQQKSFYIYSIKARQTKLTNGRSETNMMELCPGSYRSFSLLVSFYLPFSIKNF